MEIGKVFLVAIFIIYAMIIIISMIKSKHFFKALFSTMLQGICALFAVNFMGNFISVHIPVNIFTLGLSSFGGVSGVIALLICDCLFI